MSESAALLQKSDRSARLKERKKALAELFSVGHQMSNVTYNLGQSHRVIDQHDGDTMLDLSKQWDAARLRYRKAFNV